MALFDRAMKMFTPFAFRHDEAGGGAPPAPAHRPDASEADTLADLKAQMAAMQAQLAALTNKE